jgi:hypothetical protein
MSRLNEIIANIQTLLPGLNNNSQSALWRKMAEAFGYTVDIIDAEIANSGIVIDEAIRGDRYGKSGYYEEKAKAFQLGYNLTQNQQTYDYYYEVVDDAAKIVKQAAFSVVTEISTPELVLKVAKFNTTTNKLEKLNTSEKQAFDDYFLNFEIPGLPVTKITADANIFKFSCKVTYLSSYYADALKTEVSNAFTSFLTSFPFNGKLYLNDLETYIKEQVQGVRNVYISSTTITIDGIDTPFSEVADLESGYFDYFAASLAGVVYEAI